MTLSFEPNTPCEPQWFPRPITDSIESSLDLLERLEEDRKRRLRSIANVVARTPIGLGGVEDRGHTGSAGNLSPKPAGAPANNAYSRYRYYPPPSDASASLHTSYQRTDRFMTTTPSSVTTRRDRQYRRGTTPRSTTVSSGAMDTTAMRDGARTPVDGIGTAATPAANDRAYMDDTQDTSYQRNQSFRSSSSSIAFLSPPLNPRAGGGYSAVGRRQHAVRRPPYHYQRQSPEERSTYNIDTEASPMMDMPPVEDYITPPANATASQTPARGQGADIYSQRVAASQRRRRRGWDEINI